MPIGRSRVAVLALLFGGSAGWAAARAGDTAWRPMQGPAAAVGTCDTDEISEVRMCYLVRCEPGAGLVFVIEDPDLGAMGVRRVRIRAGGRRADLRLQGTGAGERRVRIADAPGLMALLRSGARWADLGTTEAKVAYSTGFDLTGAKARVGALAAACRP